MVEENVIPFEEIIEKLNTYVENATDEPDKEDGIIWLDLYNDDHELYEELVSNTITTTGWIYENKFKLEEAGFRCSIYDADVINGVGTAKIKKGNKAILFG